MRTGQEKTWTAHRVSSLRRVRGIHAYRSAEKNGEWLTMTDAAELLASPITRSDAPSRMEFLPAEQVVPDAPYQIRASDLQDQKVIAAILRKGRPCRSKINDCSFTEGENQSHPRAQRRLRRSFSGGKVTITAGVYALPDMVKAAALLKAATFDQFNENNDPHGEHDFGSFELCGRKFFWKVDYFDRARQFGSEDPSDPIRPRAS